MYAVCTYNGNFMEQATSTIYQCQAPSQLDNYVRVRDKGFHMLEDNGRVVRSIMDVCTVRG
jgi:hypothetical protein